MNHKNKSLLSVLGIACLSLLQPTARAEYLFNQFLAPTFSTDYSAWDVFYTPYGSPNKPDFAAPYGSYQTASAAGVTPPSNANPGNPSAFWDARNPTITQTGTDSAFIIGPGVPGSGNIYSFAAPTAYQLSGSTPYALGTAVLQFQTDGSLIDFSSIRLRYTNSGGAVVDLSPGEMIREYRASGSTFGGITNRTALQWNLTGLGITSYQILWNAASSSNSFQLASLDTAATFGAVVPASRTWTASGAGVWGNGANWQQGTSSIENGNVVFNNAAATNATLDANHTIGELRFASAANATIDSPNGNTLTANTGITTVAAATGAYTVNAAYQLNAFNEFEINAGTVRLNGAVSGNYGFEKSGAGTLILGGGATAFTGAVTVSGGQLQIASGTAVATSSSVSLGTGATLLVNGTLGGSGALSITGGTVGGSGVINRAFTVGASTLLSPGAAGVGTLTTGNQAWTGGGTYLLELNRAVGTTGGTDRVVLNGSLSLSSTSASPFTLQLRTITATNTAGPLLDFNPNASYTWVIASAANGITGFDPAAFRIDATGFANSYNGSFSVGQSGTDLFVAYAPVPEPSSVALMLGGCITALGWSVARRRGIHRVR